MKNKKILIILLIAILFVAAAILFISFSKSKSSSNSLDNKTNTTKIIETTSTSTTTKPADSISTIDEPKRIETKVGGQYFYYGEPAGQNNAEPKKIIITLHGTEGSAERDYEVWKPFIKDTSFAIASLNWWDGSGDTTPDYSTPEIMIQQIHDFLDDQGYTSKDIIVFEGFSRGSANSYSIVALDQASEQPLIKFAISSSGRINLPYFDSTTTSIMNVNQKTIFSKVKWILACGEKDPNPILDGCEAIEETKQIIENKGANVLAVLDDPNGGHGALTTSSLNLVNQAFQLIEQNG